MIINECLNAIGTYPNIKLTLVNDEYLLERKEFLENILPIKDNTLYLSATDLLRLNNYLLDKDNTTILLTISGSALKESRIIRVKKYTLLKDILDNYFEIDTDDYQVIANGLMQGFLVPDITNFVITDEIYAINIMKSSKVREDACINCGKCVNVCPVRLSPVLIKTYINNKLILKKLNPTRCIECGLCSYICPSKIDLRTTVKKAKEVCGDNE